jgi:hypothetical protein
MPTVGYEKITSYEQLVDIFYMLLESPKLYVSEDQRSVINPFVSKTSGFVGFNMKRNGTCDVLAKYGDYIIFLPFNRIYIADASFAPKIQAGDLSYFEKFIVA